GKAALDAFGAFSIEARIPTEAALGYARVHVHLPSAKADIAGAGFIVNAFRTVEFKVAVAADLPFYVRGETARVGIDGAYLFGTPMHDVEAAFEARRRPTHEWIEGLPDFSLSDDDTSGERLVTSARPTLGPRGHADTTVKLDLPGARGPELVDFEAAVEDVGR